MLDFLAKKSTVTGAYYANLLDYEGKSISNQPIPFPIDRDTQVSFSSKVEYFAVIRYLYLKGKTGQEIHCELTNVYGSSAPPYAQVKILGWGIQTQ